MEKGLGERATWSHRRRRGRGLGLALTGEFDLVILDIMLPDSDGFERS